MSSPRDIRMPLPEEGRIPRVGKIRLGVKKIAQSGKEYPSATDYFVVNEDGATSRPAAEGFHAVYGDEPREIEIVLPAPRVDDVLEGAYRSYGTGGLLKRKCAGPGSECVTRGPDGEWIASPCMCEKEGLDPDDKSKHCQRRWTFTIMLMDVPGVGVWQVETGSPMAAEGLAQSLRLIEQFRGHLQGAKATLRVVPRTVAPQGKPKTVHIIELGATDLTPAQALAQAAESAQRVSLPPSTLDEEPPLPEGIEPGQRVRIAGEIAEPGNGNGAPKDAADENTQVVTPEQGTTKSLLAGMSAQYKGDLYERCSIERRSTITVVKQKLNAAYDEFGWDRPFPDEPDPCAVLAEFKRLDYEAAEDPVRREDFDRFVATGQSVEPGEQASIT